MPKPVEAELDILLLVLYFVLCRCCIPTAQVELAQPKEQGSYAMHMLLQVGCAEAASPALAGANAMAVPC